MVSPAFIPKEGSSNEKDLLQDVQATPQQKAPAATTPANTTPMPGTN